MIEFKKRNFSFDSGQLTTILEISEGILEKFLHLVMKFISTS